MTSYTNLLQTEASPAYCFLLGFVHPPNGLKSENDGLLS